MSRQCGATNGACLIHTTVTWVLHSGAVTRGLDPQMCESADAVFVKFVLSVLLQFNQPFERVPDYRQWWIFMYE